ncbi:hypothetical protein DQ244_04215 [Blastococcus sp. TBT05-19]|nr:hypothetical protein DQ244_04215 [Blastococcus sp. TBT05-19]
MRSSLWTVEDAIGTDGPDLVLAVQQLPDARIGQLAEHVLDKAGVPELAIGADGVRPLINARMGAFHAVPSRGSTARLLPWAA